MLWLLKFLIYGHIHKWELLKRIRIYDEGDDPTDPKVLSLGYKYVLRCEKCGEITYRKSY